MRSTTFLSVASLALLGLALQSLFPPSARADDSIEIQFDNEPIDRKGVRPATVKFGDETSAAWMTDSTIEPSMGWTRAFRFKITDPKFQKAAQPSVDVEITYHRQTAWF